MPSKKDIVVVRAIGIDTGKNTLHMIGLDEKGTIVLREKVSRGRIATRLVNVPPCLIGIEAGMATHYMSRELVALGHRVKQVPPAYGCRGWVISDRATSHENQRIGSPWLSWLPPEQKSWAECSRGRLRPTRFNHPDFLET